MTIYSIEMSKTILTEGDDVSVHGVLADHLNVAERYEKAVESVLGGYLQSVIVGSYDDARELSNWIASANAGRVPILIVPGIEDHEIARSDNEAPTTLGESLGTSRPIMEALRSAFPRELSGGLVSKINGVVPENGALLIDESGDIFIGGHLLITGSSASQDGSGSLLAFKRELQDLAKITAKLDEEHRSAKNNVQNEKAKLTAIEERMVDLQSVVIKVERHILSLELQEKNISQDIERAERHLRVVSEESSQIKAEISDVEKRILESQENRSAAELRLKSSQESLDETLRRLADARQQAEIENLNLNEKRTRAATSSERRRSAQAALDRVITEINELERRIASLNDEIAANSDKINELRTSVAGEQKFLTTLFGRRRTFPGLFQGNRTIQQAAEREAINMPIQGTAADIIKLAMIRLHAELRERKSRARMLLQVHDELVLEVPEAEAESTARLVSHVMESAADLRAPLVCNAAVGQNWRDMTDI
ncbi:hypothetical protein J4558_27255 [Leptolyngbya sp. 15MV]|nr:hypothetical protein J4558_27255 [Leptolyngbya sp. 15MV]